MAGVVNPSMPVWVAHDEATGKIAWCPLNEGSGAVLRYGADGPEVLERLKWMRDVLAPELRRRARPRARWTSTTCTCARSRSATRPTTAPRKGTALTLEALGIEHPEVRAFIAGNGQFFLNLAMVFAKLALDCAADVPGSPVLTAIARNGVEVGIRVSGTGDQWFVGPAALPDPAKLFDGYTPADMNPDLGDSAIVETYGLGALAVAASPLAAPLGRDRPGRRSRRSRAELRTIAAGESPDIRYPDGRAAILGIDARKVAAHADLAARAHRHRAPDAGRRPDRRRRHAPAAAGLRPGRRGARLTRAEEVHSELRAALLAGEFPYGAAARRGAARRALQHEPDAGARGAAAARGRRARGARPLRRRAPEPAAGLGDARALRGPRSCSRTSRCARPTRTGSTA